MDVLDVDGEVPLQVGLLKRVSVLGIKTYICVCLTS